MQVKDEEQNASILKYVSPKGEVYDTMYQILEDVKIHGILDPIPEPGSFSDVSSFSKAVFRWKSMALNFILDFMPPKNVKSYMQRESHAKRAKKLQKQGNPVYPPVLYTAEPLPYLYKDYESYKAALQAWASLEHPAVSHPSQILNDKQPEPSTSSEPDTKHERLMVKKLKYPRGFSKYHLFESLAKLNPRVEFKTTSNGSINPDEVVKYRPSADYLPTRQTMSTLEFIEIVSNPILSSDPHIRSRLNEFIVSTIFHTNNPTLIQILQTPEKLLRICQIAGDFSSMSKALLPNISSSIPHIIFTSEHERSIISQGFNSLLSVYLLEYLASTCISPLPRTFQSLILASREQLFLFLTQYSYNLVTFMQDHLQESTKDFMELLVRLLLVTRCKSLPSVVMLFEGTILNYVSRLSSPAIYLDVFYNAEIKTIFLSCFEHLSQLPNVYITRWKPFYSMLFTIDPMYVNRKCYWVRQIVLKLLDKSKDCETLQLILDICRYFARCNRIGLVDERDSIALQFLFSSLVNKDYTGRETLALKYQIFAVLMKTPTSSIFLKDFSTSFSMTIMMLSHNDSNVSRSACKLLRVLFKYKLIWEILSHKLIRDDLVAAVSCASVELGLEFIRITTVIMDDERNLMDLMKIFSEAKFSIMKRVEDSRANTKIVCRFWEAYNKHPNIRLYIK